MCKENIRIIGNNNAKCKVFISIFIVGGKIWDNIYGMVQQQYYSIMCNVYDLIEHYVKMLHCVYNAVNSI